MDQPTLYDSIGGAPTVAAIARRFYFLVDSDPDYAALRALHADDLDPIRDSLAGFLAGFTDGPRDWFDANPGKCMMRLHRDFAITADVADQWIDAMARAIEADPVIAPAQGTVLRDGLARMARAMAAPRG